jgi:hypothetical protein
MATSLSATPCRLIKTASRVGPKIHRECFVKTHVAFRHYALLGKEMKHWWRSVDENEVNHC